MTNLNKQTFIYDNPKSISDEICKSIIEIYEEESIESINYNMSITPKYRTIQKYLTGELYQNIIKYTKRINILQKYKLFDVKNLNINFIFYIQKNSSKEINIIDRYSDKNIKLLMFIWFLNDYDGELVFFNEYKIKPKVGKLVIFPVSWCFPYKELIHMESKKYIIYGFIYN